MGGHKLCAQCGLREGLTRASKLVAVQDGAATVWVHAHCQGMWHARGRRRS